MSSGPSKGEFEVSFFKDWKDDKERKKYEAMRSRDPLGVVPLDVVVDHESLGTEIFTVHDQRAIYNGVKAGETCDEISRGFNRRISDSYITPVFEFIAEGSKIPTEDENLQWHWNLATDPYPGAKWK